MTLRSRYDREIVSLALPALGALAAEPLYLLVDTAIVGHLGRPQLAALGIAFTILGGTFAIFNFLQYGTTAQVARAGGAGEEETARRLGAQAVWLSLGFGVAVSGLIALLAPQLVALMGGEGQTADYAVEYLRIAAIGFPAAFLALGAQGYLRGVADLRTPLVVLIAGNVANVVLEVLFVYGFDWGIAGSAWGTAIAQLGMGAAFVVVVLRRLAPGEAAVRIALARRVLSLGKWIFIRTTALMLSFVLAGAVATRFGDASIAAHQVAFQLWIFLALVLDSVAIAGQIIVGRELGAGRREEAYGASERMIWLSVALGAVFAALMLVLAGVLPRAFTGDASVLDETALLWPIFALMQPLNGAVFALDGILIGASDGPFLALSMVAAFVVVCRRSRCRARGGLGDSRRLGRARRPHRRPADADDDAVPARSLARDRVGVNVLGGELEPCSVDPVTGYFRDGYCHTAGSDLGFHVVCAVMTEEFLEFSVAAGNDLVTPQPQWMFPGLRPGDRWCVVAARWQEALEAGVAPPVVLEATHASALEFVSLSDLEAHAFEV